MGQANADGPTSIGGSFFLVIAMRNEHAHASREQRAVTSLYLLHQVAALGASAHVAWSVCL